MQLAPLRIGILTYECLVGHTPWESKSASHADWLDRICRRDCGVDFESCGRKRAVTADARSFILACLDTEPRWGGAS